jgi:spore coat protein U-like protein
MKLALSLKSAAAVFGVLALGFASSANAATATTTFTVSTTVLATCTVSAGNLTFANYSGAQVDNSSTVTVTCTNTTPYNVGLNAGTATSATVTTRKMTSASKSATLAYSLYSDSTRTTNWGNTVGSDTVTGTGNGSGQGLTVYGRIPAGSYPAPATDYTDTITATVTY